MEEAERRTRGEKLNRLGITHRQTVMIVLLMIGSLVTMLNQTTVAPAIPSIMIDMSIDAATAQWLTTGFTLVNAIMVPITAYLIDRFPTRNLFLFSMIVFAIGSVFAAWGPNFGILLFGRIIQAIGAGILMPMVMTILMLTFPIERRGFAMGLFGIVMAFGPAVGPTAAGIIIDLADWHIMFYIITVLSVAVAVVTPFTMEKIPAKHANWKLDKPSVVLSTLGFGSLLYSFSIIGSAGIGAEFVITLVVGAIIIVWFFRRQLNLERPMLQVRVLQRRTFLVGTIIGMIIQAALFSVIVLVPIYLQSLMGYSATISGLVILPGAIVMGIMGPVAGRLFDRHGPRALALVGTTTLFIATVVLAVLGEHATPVIVAVIMLARMFGLSLVNMPITTWAMNSLPDELINHGTSINNTFRQIAGSLGTAILTSVFAMATVALVPQEGELMAGMHGIELAFAASAGLALIALVLIVVFVKNEVPVEEAHPGEDDLTQQRVLESIMKHDVFSINENATVFDAMRFLVDKQISAAPLIDASGKAVGFISDGDIMRYLSKRDQIYANPEILLVEAIRDTTRFDDKLSALMNMKVKDIATRGIIGVSIHAKLPEVCRVLGDNHLKKAPVLDNGKIVGVINRSDITLYSMQQYVRTMQQSMQS